MISAETLSASGVEHWNVAGRLRARVAVAGMPGPAQLALSELIAVVLRSRPNSDGVVWTGRAQVLPAGGSIQGACVIRMDYFDPKLVEQVDCVVYTPRDLRDAVLACHRYAGLAPDEQTARILVEQSRLWKAAGALVLSYESLLSDTDACVQALMRHLGLTPVDFSAPAREFKRVLIAAGLASDRIHTAPRAFLTGLPMALVGRIEQEFGDWLTGHGYPCVALSRLWAGAKDRTDVRERIWSEFDALANECRAFAAKASLSSPGIDVWRGQVERVVTACETAGSMRFQQTAMELTRALTGPNPVTELARVSLLVRQHKKKEAAEVLGRESCLEDNILAREWRAQHGNADRNGGATAVAADILAVADGKTAATPLPPVGGKVEEADEAIERLARLVRGKVVGFLLHGSSASAFPQFVAEASGSDVVWVTVNHFALLEERLLRPIGQTFSAVFCCADGEMERRLADLIGFLQRPKPKLLITRSDHLRAHAAKLEPHRAHIALTKLPPIWPYPNSLTVFLRLLVQAGARRVVLFGSDGYLGEDDVSIHTYVGAEQFVREKRYSGILLDTLLFNAHMPRVLARWQERLGDAFPEIVNCSPGTLIQAFLTIPYANAADALAGRQVTGVLPMRPADVSVPAAETKGDPRPILAACCQAARQGNLAVAREHAQRALRLDPNCLTPFAQRVLQTDPMAIAAAYHLLMLTGGTVTGSEQIRCLDLAREMRETREALGEVRRSWDHWE